MGLAKEENSVAFGRDTGLAITDKGFSIIKDYGTYTNYSEVGQKERMSKPHQKLVVESDNMDDLKLILHKILTFLDDSDSTQTRWLKMEEMAPDLEMDLKSLERHLAILESKKLVRITPTSDCTAINLLRLGKAAILDHSLLEVDSSGKIINEGNISIVQGDNLGEIYQVKDKSIFKKIVSKKRLTRIQIIQIIFGVISTIAALILIYEFLIN